MKKGFYISLAVGVVAIAAVGMIAAQNTGSQEQPEHLAQIDEQEAKAPEQAVESLTPATAVPKPESGKTLQSTEQERQTEAKVEAKAEASAATEKPQKQEPSKETKKAPEKEQGTKAPEVSQVMSGANSIKNLSFNEEDGLLWPVTGDVLLKYSMDKSIYFKTLAQYKCNPAVVIGAKEGSKVQSAGKCVITDISENEETGVTLTATLGDGYEVVYGQLKEVSASVGDTIDQGDIIGKIAKPTKYYVEEGSNLYFKVLEDGNPIDPLLLLE